MERERAHWIIAAGVALIVVTGGLYGYWMVFVANATAGEWAAVEDDSVMRHRAGDVLRLHGKVVRAESTGGDVAATLSDGTGRIVVPIHGAPVRGGQWLVATYVWDDGRGAFVLDSVKNDVQPEMVAGGFGGGLLVIGIGLVVRPRRARGFSDDDPLPGEWGSLIQWRPPADPQAVVTTMRAPSFSRAAAPGLEDEAIGRALGGLTAPAEEPANEDAPSPAALAAERAAAASRPPPPATVEPEPALEGPQLDVALAKPVEALRGKLDMVESLLEQRGLVTGFRYGERDAAYALAPGATPEDVLSVLALAGVPLAEK